MSAVPKRGRVGDVDISYRATKIAVVDRYGLPDQPKVKGREWIVVNGGSGFELDHLYQVIHLAVTRNLHCQVAIACVAEDATVEFKILGHEVTLQVVEWSIRIT